MVSEATAEVWQGGKAGQGPPGGTGTQVYTCHEEPSVAQLHQRHCRFNEWKHNGEIIDVVIIWFENRDIT